MKYTVKINGIKTVDELEGSWSSADFRALLAGFDFDDADKLKENELKEYLFMAIADFEPDEAAKLVLDYKLSEVLTEGQIDNLSHEMTREKVSENYSDISIHNILFNINQLLYKAYNGKFPLAKANVIDFEMRAAEDTNTEITKQLVLQALGNGLSDRNLIIRLFKEQLEGIASFPEAEGIIWNLQNKGDNHYQMTTSEKWIKNTDFEKPEFEGDVIVFAGQADAE